jgi:SpoVK/Ycf46/Vps4 family AAA+-type ATPase
MNTTFESIDISLPEGGFDRGAVERVVAESALPRVYEELAAGPFGKTAMQVGMLDSLVDAGDAGLLAVERLRAVILSEIEDAAQSFVLPSLSREQRQFLGAFQLVVMADTFHRHAIEWLGEPKVEGSLDLDGLGDLLAHEGPPEELLTRVIKIAAAYTKMKARNVASDALGDDERRVVGATVAFFGLLRRAVLNYIDNSSIKPLRDSLAGRQVTVLGYTYDGLEVREQSDDRSQLMAVSVEDIVGNEAYVEAGLRLARDVAGYDFDAGRNPKKLNPVLFGLGRPGSGKTITAHAVGNYFLDYCRERDVPARFRVIRRTEWASSYQNASARNLVRIFKEEVYGFDGVCGVYWPDIDTAFASRGSQGLRMEEKQNLGAVFGIFDGTLLPKDGKWFLMCDANTLHMDEATISRIAQNPVSVEGPTEPEEYVTLVREIMLGDLGPFIPENADEWQRIGEVAAKSGLSGRNMESVCNNIRSHIQDFEYPDRYFDADASEREQIIRELCRPVDVDQIIGFVDDYVEFRRDAEERDAEEQFQKEVDNIVRRLNANEAAAARHENGQNR